MIKDALSLAEKGDRPAVKRRDRSHNMASVEGPPREEIILKRQHCHYYIELDMH